METRINEPVFIRNLRLEFNLLSSQNENPPEAETGRDTKMIGFMSSEFLRIFKNSRHCVHNPRVVQKTIRLLSKNSF